MRHDRCACSCRRRDRARGLCRRARLGRGRGPVRRIRRLLRNDEDQSGLSSHRHYHAERRALPDDYHRRPLARSHRHRAGVRAANRSGRMEHAPHRGARAARGVLHSFLRRHAQPQGVAAPALSRRGAQRHRRGARLDRRREARVRGRRGHRHLFRFADGLGARHAPPGRSRPRGGDRLSRRAARPVASGQPHRRQGRVRSHLPVRLEPRDRVPRPRGAEARRAPEADRAPGARIRSAELPRAHGSHRQPRRPRRRHRARRGAPGSGPGQNKRRQISDQRREEIMRVTAFAVLTAFALLGNAQDKNWLIGEVTPLTGPAATVGTRLNNVSKLWVEEINAKGGIQGRKVELMTCNDENRPEKAVACARDMIDKGAVMIFGNSLTASLRAIQPLVRQGPILLIPSPNVVPPADSYGFQVSPSDLHLTQAIAKYLKANKLSKMGMVAATDASGEVGVESAKKVFGDEKMELKLARIDLRATDATTQLAQVAGSDVKLVYSSYTGGGAVTVVKSFKILGLPQPLMVSYGNMSEAFVSLIKDVRPAR